MTLIGECMYIIYRCVIDEYVSYLLCLVWTKSYEIPFCLRCFPQNSRFLPKNRLAGMNVPPGDTSELTQFLGSAMNHLATMNYRYAVRRCSTRFLLWCRSHCDFWNLLVYTMFDFTNANWIMGFGDKISYQRCGITMELVIEVEKS